MAYLALFLLFVGEHAEHPIDGNPSFSPISDAFRSGTPSRSMPTVYGSRPARVASRKDEIQDLLRSDWHLSDPIARERVVQRLANRSRQEKRAAWQQAGRIGWKPRGRAPDGNGYELVAIRDGRPYVLITLNKYAGISTAASIVRQPSPYHLSGAGLSVGIWDQGSVYATHQEFSGGRIVHRDGAGSATHSTHVGGTMAAAGVQANAIGMAPALVLDSYDWNSDYSEMTARAMATPGETNNLPISNHSYGPISGWYGTYWYGTWGQNYRECDYFGSYDADAATLDALCYNAPYYLPVQAAGNDRDDSAPIAGQSFQYFDNGSWQSKIYDPASDPLSDYWDNGGYDTVIAVACAKNIMTVGAVSDAVLNEARSLGPATCTSHSAWGPTDDGRVKPDIMGNGEGLYSTALGSSTYTTMSGTSMAAGNISGSAALLLEYYVRLFPGQWMRACMLKGLILHTADDLGRPGPDYSYGWGLMNTWRAADQIRRQHDLPATHPMTEDYLDPTNMERRYEFDWDGSSPLRATLCWTDPPAAITNGLDIPTPRLVDDLDLRVIGPDGATNFPYVLDLSHPTNNAVTGDNERDNVEQVYLAAPSGTGRWAVVVQMDAPPSRGRQDFALLISGAGCPPNIAHTPPGNTFETNVPYRIEATITPDYILDTNTLVLLWNTTGDTSAFFTNPLVRVSNDVYGAEIPAQPMGTTIYYFLRAASSNGFSATCPSNAPADLFSFEIAPAMLLLVTGTPTEQGTTVPPYGLTWIASGVTVNASASLYSVPVGGQRWMCTGWNGMGSVPSPGASNSFSFILRRNSSLDWTWTNQFELAHTSSPEGLVATSTWWNSGAIGTTLAALPVIAYNGTNYQFTGWQLDGVRQTDATGIVVNPVGGIAMTAAHLALASYLPEARDIDGNGLADWWELFYFGTTPVNSWDDADGDWYSNGEEYQDRSNPRDSASTPSPPVIDHTPLASPQPHPAPWIISATITDNCAIAGATLHWKRNAQLNWKQTNMTLTGTGALYAAAIPAPGTNGDSFAYKIRATDQAGYETELGPFGFGVAYPESVVTPAALGRTVLLHGTSSNATLCITNRGLAPLAWTTRTVAMQLEDSMENGTGAWSHTGANDRWHITTRRAYSGTNAWYCGQEDAWVYTNSMDAQLLTPPLQLGTAARLRFRHWIKTELDDPDHAWDGGVVEIETNSTGSFVPIPPEAGYHRLITPNPAVVFSPNQPCFADTSGAWEQAAFDLAEFAGQTVRIRFRFGSDASVWDEGWYLDDIQITSFSATPSWLFSDATNGVLAPDASTNLILTLDAGWTQPGDDVAGSIEILSNDPLNPTNGVTVAMSDRTIPTIAIATPHQSRIDDAVWVAISNSIFSADRQPCRLTLHYSPDGGDTWTNAWIHAVQAAFGTPALTNGDSAPVTDILVATNGVASTNRLVLLWDSLQGPLPIAFTTNALVRMQVWNNTFWSDCVTSQPFMVDNEPPVATGATVLIAISPSGNYAFSPVITNSWTGFHDAGAGIEGYYCSFTNAEGTTNGFWTTGTNYVLADPRPDATNVVYVWARDAAGWIGAAASNRVLVFAADGDWDRDGSPNWQEEIAGTDITNQQSLFRIDYAARTNRTQLTLRWNSCTGRQYAVTWTNAMPASTGGWVPAAGGTNLVGTGSPMSWTDTNGPTPRRYYRITVQEAYP